MTDGYRNQATRVVAEELFTDSRLAGPSVDAARRWLTAVPLPLGEGKTVADAILMLSDEVEAIVTGFIDGLLLGESLPSKLLRVSLAEVDWRAISIQLVKDVLDEITGG